MFTVISRFKVDTGHRSAVQQAFRDRPQLVDHVAGFLGMEVYTDVADPDLFYLVTRWTDLASFEAWHNSESHRLSHKFIPKGLKLISGFAQVNRLERLPTSEGLLPQQFVADATPIFAEHLARSRITHFLVAALDGTIRWANSAMASSLELSQATLPGRLIWDMLTGPDAALLRDRVERNDRNYEGRTLINFVNGHYSPFTLECHCDIQPAYFVLLGEPPRERHESFRNEWLAMNNQLAVLTRENARQNKELRQAKRELEQALADLRDSHWHLRKLQELLPICMECGKVKSGSDWEDVVQYLHKNALFLSHGYCPECFAKLKSEWGL